MGRLPLFLFITFLQISCAIADLRTDLLINGDVPADIQKKARDLLSDPIDPSLSPLKWSKVEALEFYMVDYWNSSLVRFFTPVPEPVQAMKVRLSLNNTNMDITFTDGSQRGKIYGLENGEPFVIEDASGKVFIKDSEVKVYLESLRLYLLLPTMLHKYESLAYLGEIGLGDHFYHEIFATNGSFEISENHDQYISYTRKDTGAIEFIQFTYRDVFDSYRGVIHYENYTLVDGKSIPMKIAITNSLLDEDFVHQFQIGSIQFLYKEPDYSE
ncbi:LBF_0142 family lipoprotein [Leptospira sp. GIMC2001]|uniref:LBF_0142 family lipoprotein n=1 Tax=Leptospira sp. GIMC2001 TaxID=1513297 RepID=UPI00234A4CF9|nr:hypothetical protein [Leptospira sp. GIMC2001]WCL49334.1 hypothetical protein O4O04_18900 [Leptospira sp. GIMC2001]